MASSIWFAGCITDGQIGGGANDDQSNNETPSEKAGSGQYGGELFINKVHSPPDEAEVINFDNLDVDEFDQFMDTLETASNQGEGSELIKDGNEFHQIKSKFPEDDHYDGEDSGWYMDYKGEIYQVKLIDVSAS